MRTLTEIKKDVFSVQCAAIESSSLPPSLCDDVLVALREAWYYLSQAEIYLQDSDIFKEV